MRRRTLPLLVLPLLLLLQSLPILPGRCRRRGAKGTSPTGDAPFKKNGPRPPPPSGAAGVGQKLAKAQVLCTELYFLLLQIPDDKYLL